MASFYSEIGSLDSETPEIEASAAAAGVAPKKAKVKGPNLNNLNAALSHSTTRLFPIVDETQPPVVEPKRKTKKKKPVVGLSSKMNDISGMVAKWQKVSKEYNS